MLVFYYAFKRSIRYINVFIYNSGCLVHLKVVIVILKKYCRSPLFHLKLSFKELIVVLFKRLCIVQNAGPWQQVSRTSRTPDMGYDLALTWKRIGHQVGF